MFQKENWPFDLDAQTLYYEFITALPSRLIKLTFTFFCVLKSTDPNNMVKREITQYHFSSWPDHCVPRDTAAFLMFHHKLKATLVIDPGPVVVHCRSAVIESRTSFELLRFCDQYVQTSL